jgi:Glycosyl transferase family 2
MRVHAYSLCWNEARMVPYYLRHYQSIVEQFFLYDDNSTDGSLELFRSHSNVEVQSFANEGDSFVLNSQTFTNQAWKRSRGQADWVIICNIDEHLYHVDLLNYLNRCASQGITVIPTRGYQMLSEIFPTTEYRLCDIITQGMPLKLLDKPLIFNPNAIENINYAVGRHAASPEGDVRYPETAEVKLLHYKYLGIDYLLERHAELKTGLKSQDIRKRWGEQYLWNRKKTEKEFNRVKRNIISVVPFPETLCFQ